jgi:hypothetical protein
MNDIVSIGLFHLPSTCLAYVGPGSGVTMFWALLAVLGAILFTVVGLVLWPVRLLMRSIKRKKSRDGGTGSPNVNAEDSQVSGDDKRTLPSPEHG